LLGSGFQQRLFPFLWVPELSLASATSFSQQQLIITEPQPSSKQLIDFTLRLVAISHQPPTLLTDCFSELSTYPAYNISGWNA
jgi:hypothetical protein